jgi:hypothetical protein
VALTVVTAKYDPRRSGRGLRLAEQGLDPVALGLQELARVFVVHAVPFEKAIAAGRNN